MQKRTVWIGTSGWVYKEWAGNFYPKGWPKKDEFGYYVQHFPTVEINATFYRLPTLNMVRGWHDKSPDGFLFAIKGSRFLTHIKRLRDTGPGLKKYFRRIAPLGDRAGPVLWQLPPNFAKNDETFGRLRRFLAKLPDQYQHAIEFRHPSWMDAQTHELLRQYRAANVWLSSMRMPADYTTTSDFVYLRFHGLQGGPYHDYTDDELAPWAKELAKAAKRGVPCYVYFNNDLNTRAPLNAAALMRMVGQHVVAPKTPTVHPLAQDVALPRQLSPKELAADHPRWPSKASTRVGKHRKASSPPRGRGKRPAGSPTFARSAPPVPAATGVSMAHPPTAARHTSR